MKEEEEEESGSLAPLFRNKYHNIQERRDKANVSLNNKKKSGVGKANRTSGGSLPPGVGYYTLSCQGRYICFVPQRYISHISHISNPLDGAIEQLPTAAHARKNTGGNGVQPSSSSWGSQPRSTSRYCPRVHTNHPASPKLFLNRRIIATACVKSSSETDGNESCYPSVPLALYLTGNYVFAAFSISPEIRPPTSLVQT